MSCVTSSQTILCGHVYGRWAGISSRNMDDHAIQIATLNQRLYTVISICLELAKRFRITLQPHPVPSFAPSRAIPLRPAPLIQVFLFGCFCGFIATTALYYYILFG